MRSRQKSVVLVVYFHLCLLGSVMAADFEFHPYVTEDGREKVGNASVTLDGWTDDEIRRYAARPDFAEVFLESDDPPYTSEWAYHFLKGNPGKTIAWLDSFLVPQGPSKVSIRKLCWYVIYPSDVALHRNRKVMDEPDRWHDLLIKPPVEKWLAIQDGPRSAYLGEWGGSAGFFTVDGRLFGSAKSRLQRKPIIGAMDYAEVRVFLRPDPIPDHQVKEWALNQGSFYDEFLFALEPAEEGWVIAHHVYPNRTKKDQGPYHTWAWRSGTFMIWITGSVDRRDDLLQAYLKKFPSDLPLGFPLTPEGWVMDLCSHVVPTLREHVSSQDKELGLVGKDPFEEALSNLMLTKDGDAVRAAYLREAQRLAKTLLWEGRRYEWPTYQQSLRALRQQSLDQIEALVTAMEQRGIVHDGKKWVVKDPP